jgi:hypothetical protein
VLCVGKLRVDPRRQIRVWGAESLGRRKFGAPKVWGAESLGRRFGAPKVWGAVLGRRIPYSHKRHTACSFVQIRTGQNHFLPVCFVWAISTGQNHFLPVCFVWAISTGQNHFLPVCFVWASSQQSLDCLGALPDCVATLIP